MSTPDLRATGPAVTCEDLVKIFRSATGETHALRGIGLAVGRGAVTVVGGPSGSGKSSLLAILGARDRPSAGQVDVLGHDLVTSSTRVLRRLRRHDIGYVPQRSSTGLLPHLDARSLLGQVATWRGVEDDLAPAVEDALARVDLDHRGDHRPGALSGGEQQRLAVTAALLGSPALVIADEPTAELDDEHAERVVDVLHEAAARGAAVVVSSHDERVTGRADRLLRLRHGVLSTEAAARGPVTAVIDASGRLQLPPAVLELYPSRRVVVEVDGDAVHLRRPEDPS